jgi:hypothetical protein
MDHNLLPDDITTIDDALTPPWAVKKTYRRMSGNKPISGARGRLRGKSPSAGRAAA